MNIWQSVECDAWSRNFNYEDYLYFHMKSGDLGRVFTRQGYEAFCELMDSEMERDMNEAFL